MSSTGKTNLTGITAICQFYCYASCTLTGFPAFQTKLKHTLSNVSVFFQIESYNFIGGEILFSISVFSVFLSLTKAVDKIVSRRAIKQGMNVLQLRKIGFQGLNVYPLRTFIFTLY